MDLARPGLAAARAWRGLASFWAVLESMNGVVHLLLALAARGYFPGAATAPLLLALGLGLAMRLRFAPAS